MRIDLEVVGFLEYLSEFHIYSVMEFPGLNLAGNEKVYSFLYCRIFIDGE